MYGETIKKLMIQHHFETSYELAKASGLTPIGLSKIISNKVAKPNRSTLEKLGSAFGLTVSELKGMANGK